MRVSGKYVLLVLFGIAVALCWWVRIVAPKLTPSENKPSTTSSPQRIRGYRTKMFPTMEQARTIAEKKISENSSQKNIITKYEASGDGWIFYYEPEKYLNSGKIADKIGVTTPIVVHKDGTAEYFSDVKKPY
jgi:hypothetical protein